MSLDGILEDNNMNVQKMVEFQMMTQVLKTAFQNSDSFDIIMQSLINSMSDSNGNIDLSKLNIGQEDLSNLGYGAGERLNNIYTGVKEDIKSGNMTIDEAVDKASRKYGVDRDFIMAVIKQESDFNPESTSGAGAMGLMQLMPGTARELGVTDAYDVEQNVDGGTEYLKKLLNMYGNSREMALAAYNAGSGTLASRGVDSISKISRLPYETQNYVQKVIGYYKNKTV
ncbi:transglycosylase SLT domain-containing protein [Clostridium tyrobutyricum]|uniref:Soluble lytic murein transglycosylase and related regulatory proteins (Some contain LysM/invasin domains) n=1 Tax=Clostridium tyrobutyricum DIVETGP TaxID=1408889 RepID=W6N6I7_CLOTY|nr:lytic transglycosylase domain-containing protein [Clostridium tyrobutyricum]AND85859.1 murein lytic transglycosylase-like protein [Clostridium tyrobutyricum]ANP70371.1 lytic transglycosylase [Clostridium tyrobutyricum]MBV4434599.1 lytic transglycosylase domain-containing protein [Clostridium tyrobutyricum]QNB67995.1 transglycosylase SLT domain-containing protein [Clostridium tyrobutyricum]CDL91800.1 Soluble lytic murein transglycosylase and related regulatory proteins (some contain LysM/inv